MRLHEEFKLWEDLWDDDITEPDPSAIMWKNEYGVNINLNDPSEFEKELKDEANRYRSTLQNGPWPEGSRMYYNIQIQKLVDSGKTEDEAKAELINQEVEKHIKRYESRLQLNLNIGLAELGNIDSIKATRVNEPYIEKHYSKVFDLTDERSLIAYIDYYFLQYKHPRIRPNVWINSLQDRKAEIVCGLATRGLHDLAKKAANRMDKHLAKRTLELKQNNDI